MQLSINVSPQQYIPKGLAAVPQSLNVNQNINGGTPIALASQQCNFVQVNNPLHDNTGAAQNNPIKVLINGVVAEEMPAGSTDTFPVSANANEISLAFVTAAEFVHTMAIRLPSN